MCLIFLLLYYFGSIFGSDEDRQEGMSTSEGQSISDVLEIKSERPDRGGLDMFRGETVNISLNRC